MEAILKSLDNDEISDLIKKDALIISYGEDLCLFDKFNHKTVKKVRSHLRNLGRILQAMKEADTSITCMKDVYDKKTLDSFVTCGKKTIRVQTR